MAFTFYGKTLTGLSVPPTTIEKGAIIGLSGRSGSGKSRLMRALVDLDASEMQLALDGVQCFKMPPQTWRSRILYCAATPAWWDSERIDTLFQTSAQKELLEKLGLDRAVWSVPVAELSTGEQQRVHVARYLIKKPDVLLLDEPTSALDKETTATVEQLIREFARDAAVVLTSHSPEQLDRLSTRRWRISGTCLEETE